MIDTLATYCAAAIVHASAMLLHDSLYRYEHDKYMIEGEIDKGTDIADELRTCGETDRLLKIEAIVQRYLNRLREIENSRR